MTRTPEEIEALIKEAVSLKKIPDWFRSSVSGASAESVLAGYRRAAQEAGPESFLAALPSMAANKLFGKGVAQKKIWKYVSQPAMMADTYVGHKMSKIPGMKGLFTLKEQVDLGGGLHRDIHRASALAPIVKARNMAAPIIVGVGFEKGLHSIKDKMNKVRQETGLDQHVDNLQRYLPGSDNNKSDTDNHELRNGHGMMKKMSSESRSQADCSSLDGVQLNSVQMDSQLREKVASTMLRLHDENKGHKKRAQATRLLYKQAELGFAAVPQSYQEFEQKLASLMSQDLAVLEKALELSAGNVKIGELSGSDSIERDAAATFQAMVLDYD